MDSPEASYNFPDSSFYFPSRKFTIVPLSPPTLIDSFSFKPSNYESKLRVFIKNEIPWNGSNQRHRVLTVSKGTEACIWVPRSIDTLTGQLELFYRLVHDNSGEIYWIAEKDTLIQLR